VVLGVVSSPAEQSPAAINSSQSKKTHRQIRKNLGILYRFGGKARSQIERVHRRTVFRDRRDLSGDMSGYFALS